MPATALLLFTSELRVHLDLDEASNWGNWQWTAGTGNGSWPNRGFNHARRAERYDPDWGLPAPRWSS